jgi:hypothetical protein
MALHSRDMVPVPGKFYETLNTVYLPEIPQYELIKVWHRKIVKGFAGQTIRCVSTIGSRAAGYMWCHKERTRRSADLRR